MWILPGIIALLAAVVGLYADHNLHADERRLRRAMRAGFAEKQCTLADGTVLHYAEGPNNGSALLLIHGQTMCWKDYAPVLTALSKRWHVFAVDCHGHGESSHNPNDYSCRKMGDDFIAFLRSVVGEPCVVSGHSSGGVLAAYVAANGGDLVRGAVLEDPPFFSVTPDEMQNTFVWKDAFAPIHEYLRLGSPEGGYASFHYKHGYMWPQFGKFADKLAESAAKQHAADPSKPIRFWYVPRGWTHGDYYLHTFDLRFSEAFYSGAWVTEAEQEDMLRRAACPTVYLKAATAYGKDGVLYAANTDEQSDRMLSLLPDARRVTIKSSHDIHDAKPKEFVAAFEPLQAPNENNPLHL